MAESGKPLHKPQELSKHGLGTNISVFEAELGYKSLGWERSVTRLSICRRPKFNS